MTSKSPFHAPALVAQCPLSTTGAQVRKNTEIVLQFVGEALGALQVVILSDSQTQRADSCCKAPTLHLIVDCEPKMFHPPKMPQRQRNGNGTGFQRVPVENPLNADVAPVADPFFQPLLAVVYRCWFNGRC